MTDTGYAKLVESAPAHVAAVRSLVIDEFTPTELRQLRKAAERIAARVDAVDPPWSGLPSAKGGQPRVS
jgi:cytochrome P450